MKAMCRPAFVMSVDDEIELDREFKAANWVHHRLLDFEDEHQKLIDAAAEAAAPRIIQIGRIVSKLRRRVKRKRHSTGWSPPLHEAWHDKLSSRLRALRVHRDQSPEYRAALKWDRESDPEATVKATRRKTTESDEQFEARKAAGKRRSRREAYRTEQVYPERRCHWSTFNDRCKSVDQARSDVIHQRAMGLSSDWHRPRFGQSQTLHFEPKSWRVVEQEAKVPRRKHGNESHDWWIIELATHEQRVRVRAKFGNWHDTSKSTFKTAKLTRVKDGHRWRYSLSLCVDVVEEQHPGTGVVALDWGHREKGHPQSSVGIRAWTWIGDDGHRGVIVLPAEMREEIDLEHEIKSQVDKAWAARRKSLGIRTRSRFRYRNQLLRQGVRSEEELLWLKWEARQDDRMRAARARASALRREAYLRAIRDLRQRYVVFVTEDEPGKHHRKLDTEEETKHRKRENRDLVARYLFLTLCKNTGARVLTVPAFNTTRECPDCGNLDPNGPELLMVCSGCGRVRDKDYGASKIILRLGQAALVQEASAAQ